MLFYTAVLQRLLCFSDCLWLQLSAGLKPPLGRARSFCTMLVPQLWQHSQPFRNVLDCFIGQKKTQTSTQTSPSILNSIHASLEILSQQVKKHHFSLTFAQVVHFMQFRNYVCFQINTLKNLLAAHSQSREVQATKD